MTEYNKKKKLIEENKDMYISEHDKNLSYDALSQIVDAKKHYADAAKNNDKKQMTLANNAANAVRAKYGSYTGGEFGDEYHPFSYSIADYDDYNSKYEDELDSLYESLRTSKNKFTYDPEKDPVYLAYKSVYDTKGDLAYERALAKNSLRTGGMVNSDAQSAAMQAMNYYNSQLAAMIPQLYEAAYERYYRDETDRLDRLKDSYNLIKDRESRDYDRHLDRLSHQINIRDYYADRTEKERDRIFDQNAAQDRYDYEYEMQKSKQEQSDREREQNLFYDIMRDEKEDEKWKNDYTLDLFKSLYSGYSDRTGGGDILSYARELFGNPNLTMQDLYNILGL